MTKQELTMVLQESPMYTVNHPTHMTSFTLQCRLAYAICYPILTLLYTVYISMCQISRHLFPVALPVRPVYHGSKRGRRYHWRRHRCAQHLRLKTTLPTLSWMSCINRHILWKPVWYFPALKKREQGLKIHQGNTIWNTKFQSLCEASPKTKKNMKPLGPTTHPNATQLRLDVPHRKQSLPRAPEA